MKTVLLIHVSILLLALLILADCQSGTEPENKIKNPREMTWTADTLSLSTSVIQLLPEDLMVVSSEDIWLCVWVGHGQIYHYNGKAWKMVKEIGGGINCLELGLYSDTIWAGGYIGRGIEEFKQNAYIGTYDGNVWHDNEFQIQSELLDICKDQSGNLFACGRDGIVMEKEANNWIADTLIVGYKKKYADAQFVLHSIEYYNNQIYVLGSIYDFSRGNQIHYCITGNINNWTVKDSMLIDSPNSPVTFGNNRIYSSAYGKLYSVGALGVWEFANDTWAKLYNANSTIYKIYGIDEQYLFAAGDNELVFYDGNSWNSLVDLFNSTQSSTIAFTDVWTDGNETIITGYTVVNGKERTIIWHGK